MESKFKISFSTKDPECPHFVKFGRMVFAKFRNTQDAKLFLDAVNRSMTSANLDPERDA